MHVNDDPVLHDIVKKCMIHGPCGTDNPSSLGTRFRAIDTYYYRCNNTTQVAGLTNY